MQGASHGSRRSAQAENKRRHLSPRFCHLTKPGCFLPHFYPQPVDNSCGLCAIFCRIHAYFTLFFLSVYFVSKIGHFVCPTAQQAAKLL